MWPELREHLQDAADIAQPGLKCPVNSKVVSQVTDSKQILRTHMLRMIKRAGLNPWPKLFQNLRASQQIELAQAFPLPLVCEWIGNSAAIAQEHYLQVRDEDLHQATQFRTVETAAVFATSRALQVTANENCDARNRDDTQRSAKAWPVRDSNNAPKCGKNNCFFTHVDDFAASRFREPCLCDQCKSNLIRFLRESLSEQERARFVAQLLKVSEPLGFD